jgi:uncharacterized protein YndB with AHSA1/START domain
MENTLTITRTFNVPRDHVFRAWTDPEVLKRWWGPKGFTCPYSMIDLRPGGKYLHCMRGPDGKDYWSTGVYKEITIPDRIVATDSFADENGKIVPATQYGMSADIPVELGLTVSFEEHDGKTTMTLVHSGMPEGEAKELSRSGWNESLDKLDALLS